MMNQTKKTNKDTATNKTAKKRKIMQGFSGIKRPKQNCRQIKP